MKIAIVAIFKNEFSYILEWISYHLEIGVDHFYIADNVSDDGTSELLEALDDLGIITRVHSPRVNDIGPQVPAYNKILKKYGTEVDLMAFIDADEFIVTNDNISIKDVLKRFYDSSSSSALAVNWKVIGSSGFVIKPEGLVIENYVKSSRIEYSNNHHIKSIVKPSKIEKLSVHDCILKSGEYVNTKQEKGIFPDNASNFPKTNKIIHEHIFINHYVTKSKMEHFIDKANKGSAAGSKKRKKGIEYFNEHDRNEKTVTDFSDSILNLTKKRMRAIEKKLFGNSAFMKLTNGICDIEGNKVRGWVNLNPGDKIKVKVTVNNVEHIAQCNLKRPDVLRKGLTSEVCCGFSMSLNTDVSASDAVHAFVYGSVSQLRMNIR